MFVIFTGQEFLSNLFSTIWISGLIISVNRRLILYLSLLTSRVRLFFFGVFDVSVSKNFWTVSRLLSFFEFTWSKVFYYRKTSSLLCVSTKVGIVSPSSFSFGRIYLYSSLLDIKNICKLSTYTRYYFLILGLLPVGVSLRYG